MIFHVVALADWQAVPDGHYAPSSLSKEGFVHCSPDEETALAVATDHYSDAPGPLVALLIDEQKLDAQVRWEQARPDSAGTAPRTLYPHIFGPVNRDAVVGVMQIERDGMGRAVELTASE
ncbi:DUF952 domain-containing protein [Streptomyces sp. NPDC088387]|uniref:DUF952 domain-containing protein n=1 Tax=Streptomyces sp. NPDC088387 TaxID=3365859 RepID=UPI00382B9374